MEAKICTTSEHVKKTCARNHQLQVALFPVGWEMNPKAMHILPWWRAAACCFQCVGVCFSGTVFVWCFLWWSGWKDKGPRNNKEIDRNRGVASKWPWNIPTNNDSYSIHISGGVYPMVLCGTTIHIYHLHYVRRIPCGQFDARTPCGHCTASAPVLTKIIFYSKPNQGYRRGNNTWPPDLPWNQQNTQRRNELVTVGVLEFILALNGPLLYILVAGNRSLMKRFELIPPSAPNCSLKSKHQRANQTFFIELSLIPIIPANLMCSFFQEFIAKRLWKYNYLKHKPDFSCLTKYAIPNKFKVCYWLSVPSFFLSKTDLPSKLLVNHRSK